MKKLADNKT